MDSHTNIKIAAIACVTWCLLLWSENSMAGPCHLDWNSDGIVDIDDLIGSNPSRGYYMEWFIWNFYPEDYSTEFPERTPGLMDHNLDGVIDVDDLMDGIDK